MPELTIITVSLNAVSTIEEAIVSVIGQTFKNFEFIIVDGDSSDGTVDILERYKQKKLLHFVSEPDKGIYDAMNKGLRMAKGKWIYFLGSDDKLFDHTILEKVFQKPHEDAQVIYGNVLLLHSGKVYDGPFDHEKISKNNLCHQSMFIRRSLYQDLGNFNTEYPIAADYEFNFKWMGLGIPAVYVDETICIYNERGSSYHILDVRFIADVDKLLVENNIVCQRAFDYLKKKNIQLINSRSYKVGEKIVAFVPKMINQLKQLKRKWANQV